MEGGEEVSTYIILGERRGERTGASTLKSAASTQAIKGKKGRGKGDLAFIIIKEGGGEKECNSSCVVGVFPPPKGGEGGGGKDALNAGCSAAQREGGTRETPSSFPGERGEREVKKSRTLYFRSSAVEEKDWRGLCPSEKKRKEKRFCH